MTLASAKSAGAHADMRQLRHHTKNALQSILAQLSTGLGVTDASRRVAKELERRIILTSQISDALFGFTRMPGPFPERLRALAQGVIELMGEGDQYLTLDCRVEGPVPARIQEAVLRVAHEFVGNAVKHGMCMRLIGRITVMVTSQAGGTLLQVSDDGWGCGRRPCLGEGMKVASALADAVGGQITLERCADRTVAQLLVPPTRQGLPGGRRHDA